MSYMEAQEQFDSRVLETEEILQWYYKLQSRWSSILREKFKEHLGPGIIALA